MTMPASTPNRPLDLDELEAPHFARVLRDLDALTRRESISYLHPSKRWEYPWALERARLRPAARLLDAGCGASIFPVYLARQGHQVTAVDLAPPVGLDRAHGVSIDYVRAGITALPFADDSFDTVFCISVIEHLGHAGVPLALQELRRVLRLGGQLLVTTDYYEDADAKLWYEGADGRFPVDWSFFDEAHVRRFLLQAPGLAVDGDISLNVDWDEVRPAMRRFHGYPYTSVGVALVKVPS
jgi:SAM-dependent methyltransferase